MNIHFVCSANTFRSRLAETYLNSKKLPGIKVSSSGVDALKDENGPVSWYAQKIIEQTGMVPTEKLIWTQTTKEILEAQDLVIFMQQWHYDQCIARFGYKGTNFEIWDIEDVTDAEHLNDTVVAKTEAIFNKIKIKVEDLVARNFTKV
jgi:protein-tyrosine-phosphatase